MHRGRSVIHPRARALATVMLLLWLWVPNVKGQHTEAESDLAGTRLSVVLPEESIPDQPEYAGSKPTATLTPLMARAIVAGAGEAGWTWNRATRTTSSPFRQSQEDERKRRRRRQLFIAGWAVVGVGLATILLISQGGGGEDGLPSPPDRPGLY